MSRDRRGDLKPLIINLRWAFGPVILFWLALSLFLPAIVAGQQLPSPTPDAEGNIIVIVQSNDSLWAIAARAGITIEMLYELNNLSENSVIQPGDQLIVGSGPPPATATSNIPTATFPPPTATTTAAPSRTAICLLAFDDVNRDAVRDPSEATRPGVAFTVFNEDAVVANHISDSSTESFCLQGLEAGEYHVTRSIVHNEVLTTRGDWAISLGHDHIVELEFGSYISSGELETPVATLAPLVNASESQGQENPEAIDVVESRSPRLTAVILFLTIGISALLIGTGVLLFWVVRNYANKTTE